MTSEPAPIDRLLPHLAATGLLTFLFAVVLLHALRSDYDPASRFLSEYALGTYGGVMTVALLATGVAMMALGMAVYRQVRGSAFLVLGCGLLLVAGIAECLLAVYPTDLYAPNAGPKIEATTTGTIHDQVAAFNAMACLVAPLVLSLGFRRDEKWRSFFVPSLTAGIGVAACFLVASQLPRALRGAGQRLWVALVLVWCLSLTLRLTKQPGQPRVH